VYGNEEYAGGMKVFFAREGQEVEI
jgi:hypothetical protein